MTNLDLLSIKIILSTVIKNTGLELDEVRSLPLKTTNSVFRYKDIILKKNYDKESFLAEITVYKNKSLFAFCTPDLLAEFDDPNNGYWLALNYIPSKNILEFLGNDPSQAENFALEIASAINDFENKSINLPHLAIKKWSMTESLGALYKVLENEVAVELLNCLKEAISLADQKLVAKEYFPCFDAFIKNILVKENNSPNGNDAQLYYCDFDKANRSVPQGEQLSHLFMYDHLQHHAKQAIYLYALNANKKETEILDVINLTVFARALAGLRDNIKWEINNQSNDEKQRRYIISSLSISMATQFLPVFAAGVDLNKDETSQLEQILHKMKEIIETKFRVD